MIVNLERACTTLTFLQVVEAFGSMANGIYKEKSAEITDELIPLYDHIDHINNGPYTEEIKTLAHVVLNASLPKRYTMLTKSLEHLRKVRNMSRFYGIGGRGVKKQLGMAILPLEEAKQIPFEYIHEFEKIKRNRGGFMAICPLHGEKTPSFSVKNNYFHCFGCGKKGSTIDFIMQLNGMTFVDAVKWLGKINYRGGA